MPKKTYKNKGVPVKGSEVRLHRNIRLTDSAWDALDEIAKLTKLSRPDVIEWWTAVLTNNEAKLAEIAANENCSVEELFNRIIEGTPHTLGQILANRQENGRSLPIQPPDKSQA